MLLSVVVPTCDRPADLARLLSSLHTSLEACPADVRDRIEIIVTNDGGPSEVPMPPGARLVEGPHRGPAANRNHGASLASGEWLLFVDDDCIPSPDLLPAYLRTIAEEPAEDVLEGATLAERPRRRLDEQAPLNVGGGWWWTCNLAVRRRTFLDHGAFDEEFPYAAMEDVEFRTRLRKAGVRSRFVPEASLVHPWRIADPHRDWKAHQASTRVYLRRHPDEAASFGTGYYLRCARAHLRQVLQDAPRMRGRGLTGALRAIGYDLRHSIDPPGRAVSRR